MNVLLVSPISTVWSAPELLPLGLAYLAATLRQAGHSIAVFDAVVEDEPLEARMARERFDLVGVTSCTPLIYEAWAAAAAAKRHSALTVLGGPHPTILPEESAARPEVDFVVRGEGEDAIVELCAALGEGGTDSPALAGLAGLTYKRDGQVVSNPARPLRRDLDSLPYPAYDLFRLDRYTNLQPLTDGLRVGARSFCILTSRGCPYECIYCSKAIEGRLWRARSVESVVAEWRWLVREMGATEIGLADDSFSINVDRAKEICRRLIAEGLNTVPWITMHGMRADASDLELFQLMKRAGCKRVGFGVESGNQCVLDIMKKQQTPDDVRRAFVNAKKAGLQTMGFFMFGLPGEDEQAAEQTIRLAIELDPDMANFMITSPFPGTELHDLVQAKGHFLFENDWANYAIHDERARYELDGVQAEWVERKWHEAYRRFYLRPSRVLKKALQADTWRHLPTYLKNAKRFFVRGH